MDFFIATLLIKDSNCNLHDICRMIHHVASAIAHNGPAIKDVCVAE